MVFQYKKQKPSVIIKHNEYHKKQTTISTLFIKLILLLNYKFIKILFIIYVDKQNDKQTCAWILPFSVTAQCVVVDDT